VDVTVVQPRNDATTVGVDDLRPRAPPCEHVGVASDRDEAAVACGERRRLAAPVIQGGDPGIRDDQIGVINGTHHPPPAVAGAHRVRVAR
jgi:hypothetical protein